MTLDTLAIALAVLAIVLRLAESPRAAAISGYTSAACSAIAGGLARRRARLRSEAD